MRARSELLVAAMVVALSSCSPRQGLEEPTKVPPKFVTPIGRNALPIPVFTAIPTATALPLEITAPAGENGSPNEIIKRKARELGIQENPAELRRWQEITLPSPNISQSDPRYRQELDARLVGIYRTMRSSDIRPIQEAIRRIDQLIAERRLVVVPQPSLIVNGKSTPFSVDIAMGANGKLTFTLWINENDILNTQTMQGINAGLELTRGAKYIGEMDRLIVPAAVSDAARVSYAEAAEAYIVAVSQGYIGGVGSHWEDMAVNFIAANRNPQHPLWQRYIEAGIAQGNSRSF